MIGLTSENDHQLSFPDLFNLQSAWTDRKFEFVLFERHGHSMPSTWVDHSAEAGIHSYYLEGFGFVLSHLIFLGRWGPFPDAIIVAIPKRDCHSHPDKSGGIHAVNLFI